MVYSFPCFFSFVLRMFFDLPMTSCMCYRGISTCSPLSILHMEDSSDEIRIFQASDGFHQPFLLYKCSVLSPNKPWVRIKISQLVHWPILLTTQKHSKRPGAICE